MDFSFDDDQRALAELAQTILRDASSHEALRALERSGAPRFDRGLWKRLAEAGLLGIALPEAHGGAGLGFLELALVAEQAGRTVAAVPLLETLVLGALPIAAFGDEAQRERWLPRVAQGAAVLTAALQEADDEATLPPTRATREGEGFRLDGEKPCVPAGAIADLFLVPARSADGATSVFLVEASLPGLRVVPLDTTAGHPDARLELDGARVAAEAVLGRPGQGAEIEAWTRLRGTAALCSQALGVCAEALRLTAEYVKSRKQFDQAIGTFQAVGQRAADAYVDTEAIRLTSWQAAWRIAAGLPAEEAVAVAKFWAAEGGQRVVHTAQHLHGGIGVDRDYPLHRYFLLAKQIELSLGGATRQLRGLGRRLAGRSPG
ncbi:MAG TPA: acyl-CoA dehydrogenase family protein [Myxococcota bacterium]|nr:acyl-CoA dehydrogenase family protein [Myxococcota bacterium]